MTTAEAEGTPSAGRTRRETWALVVLLLAALGLRVAALVDYEANHPHAEAPLIDEASYDAWAREISAGDWIGDEVFFQEPLYPYALGTVYAVTGDSRTAARSVQVALGVLTVLLVWLLGRRVFGKGAGWVAATLVALHPVAVVLPCYLLKPNLFLPLFAALCLALTGERDGAPRRWLAVGALAALGALLRGNLLVLLPVLALWPLRARRDAPELRRAAAFVLGVALVLGPVALRNRAVGGVFALTTSGAGTNVYGGNSLENPYGVATEFPWVRGVPEHEATDWRVEAERRSGRALDAGETSRFWMGELLSSMREHPVDHARVLWNKLRLTLGATEVADNHYLAWDAKFVRVLRLPLPGWGVLGVLGLAGLVAWTFTRREVVALRRGPADRLAVLFVLYLGTIVLTVTSMRARVPLVVPLAPFAGYAAVRLYGVLRGARGAEAAVLVASLAGAAVLVHVPVFGSERHAEDMAERDHNLAVEWMHAGRHADAATIAAELVRDHPRSARLVILDVSARAELVFDELALGGEPEDRHAAELQACLQRLRAVYEDERVSARERGRAAGVAARIQLGLGQAARAERQLRRAREFAPADADLLAAHARVLAELLAEGETPREELDAALRSVLADLERYGDPEGWRERLSDPGH